ncbi:MAG: STAS/SEC14 domain-containing protein [Nannocystaceae bacterium]|nr:STAS/SEC14 domain-containing protein [Myxococcales bacterium]
MLERINDLSPGVIGLRAVGKVSKEDYEQVLEPILDDARREGRRIRFLYQFGPEFEGFTASGAWEDARVGLGAMRQFDGCAIVSDISWIRESTRFFGAMMPCPMRVFGDGELARAVDWLQSLPEHHGVTHRLLPESGVIVVEVSRPLRAEDFDALALTADAWIESHGTLAGVVIHARRFPGWEGFGGLVRHIRFIRDHHRHVARIAVAAESELAKLAPHIAGHFVAADVQRFAFDELDQAIAWAAGGAPAAAS